MFTGFFGESGGGDSHASKVPQAEGLELAAFARRQRVASALRSIELGARARADRALIHLRIT